jgi:DNA topoisomerase III
VDQAEIIKKFVPEPHWSIEAVTLNEKGKAFSLKWGRGKIFERNIVTILHSRIAGITSTKVTNVERNQIYKSKPHGLNTVKMLKVAS